jgi:hypothetical protein
MSAGATISGQDGIIKINGATEIGMLTGWTYATKADIKALDTRVMLSNGDGGSSATGGWDKQVVGAKSATLEITQQWQETDITAATAALRTDQVGALVTFSLFPNKNVSGKRVIAGNARISSISVPSTVDGVVTQTTSLVVDGQPTDTPVA